MKNSIDISKLQRQIEEDFLKRFLHVNYEPAYLSKSIEGYCKTQKGNRRTNS